MFDYSVDGKNWTTYGWVATATADQTHGDWHGTFQNVGGEGLQQRDMTCPTPTSTDPPLPTPCNPPTSNPGFRAQYIRVYTRDGGNTFAVSELMLWDTAGNPVPTTRLGYGPEPSFINGEFAPEGTSWNDTHWVTKLGACSSNGSLLNPNSKCPAAAPGVAAPISAAKQIDLTAVFPISQIIIQAESSNTYQVDGSLDGTSWTHLWTVPVGSGGGMRTRQPKVFTGTLPQARYVRVYATAGSNGEYSVSELQVFTPQANTAGAYGTVEDSDGFFSSRGANDGQNFVCSYEGPITTALGVVSPDNGSVQSFGTLPIQFYVVYVSLNAHCSDGNNYNIAAAHDRQCSMTLVPPPSLAPPFTDHFQAGLCGGTNAPAILSYLQFDDDPESGSNSAVQFASKDQPVPYPSGHPSDLDCTDFSSLDAHIPDVLRGVVPGIVAGATRQAMNEVLDYRANQLIPFPRVPGTTPGQTVPVTCPTTGEEEPPTPAPDNIRTLSGHATGVGGDRGRATLRVSGRFTAEHAVALDQAALTVHSLLDEAGVGDTVQGVLLLTLQPSNGSKADKGLYHTPTGARPIVSARVAPGKGSRDGSMDFEIEVKNATIREPVPCRDGLATAPLRTSFQLVGGSAEPIWVHAETEWQCNDTQLLTP